MINVLSMNKSRASLGNSIKFSRPTSLLLAGLESFEALAECLGHGSSHGFARFLGQLSGKLVCFGILDVETHILPLQTTVYPSILRLKNRQRNMRYSNALVERSPSPLTGYLGEPSYARDSMKKVSMR